MCGLTWKNIILINDYGDLNKNIVSINKKNIFTKIHLKYIFCYDTHFWCLFFFTHLLPKNPFLVVHGVIILWINLHTFGSVPSLNCKFDKRRLKTFLRRLRKIMFKMASITHKISQMILIYEMKFLHTSTYCVS